MKLLLKIAKPVVRFNRWFDLHMAWFFTNGNKAGWKNL